MFVINKVKQNFGSGIERVIVPTYLVLRLLRSSTGQARQELYGITHPH